MARCDFDKADVCRVCGRKNLYPGAYRMCSKTAAAWSQCSAGVGTQLKQLLARFGIRSTASCSCNEKARRMDKAGIDWCEANTDTIVGWLREEAAKRQLPFVDMAGRLLVKRAIRNARKAAS